MASGCRRNIFSFLIIVLLAAIMHSPAEPASRTTQRYIQVCRDKSHCITAEIAATREEHMRGLMYRENLPEDRGMLFVYAKNGYWNFWMKNTKIPLDIIWLDKTRRIIQVVREAQPCVSEPCRTYFSKAMAAYVLELASGMSKKWHLHIGDQLIFDVPAGVVNQLKWQ